MAIGEATIAPSSAYSAIRQAGRPQPRITAASTFQFYSSGGEQDWARPSEREYDRKLIPGIQMTHFVALDRPQELNQSIVRFAAHAHSA